MADVFISFASPDRERVERIHGRLTERGFDVWWMHQLLPGDSVIKTVSRELEGATNVVLAWSRHAEASPYVEGEIMYAFGARKLVPVRVEKWSWPAFLASVQYVDLTLADDQDEAWRRIESRLRGAVSTETYRHMPSDRQVASTLPRSAGPVRTLAAAMVVLMAALVGVLSNAYQAVLAGDIQALEVAQAGITALPVLAAIPLFVAARRVWRTWRASPTSLQRTTS
jgi:hypothetical protein